jgi:hypothetical protein
MIRCRRTDCAFGSGVEGNGEAICRWRACASCDWRTVAARVEGPDGGERSAESNSDKVLVVECGDVPESSESE